MSAIEVSPDHSPDQVPVHVAWSRCMRDIEAVGKNRTNEQQGYRFRSIEDFIEAASPVFVQHGIVMLPNVVEHRLYHFDRLTSNNKPSTATVATMRTEWTVIGPMGDAFTYATVGEGADTADKATNKAMTAAYKYAISQGLAVRLGLDDGDASNGANEGEGRQRTQRAQRSQSTQRTSTSSGSSRQRQARQDAPAAPAETAAQGDEVKLPAAQERLRARIQGLPDEYRAQVAQHLKENHVNLREPVATAVLKEVGAFIDALA